MWESYPSGRYPCQDQNSKNELIWKNQCAIRLSIAVVGAGFQLKGYTDPKCSHGHARGAESLANYLWRQVGRPQQATNAADARKLAGSGGSPGIIFFRNLDGFREGEGDHIDLWNCVKSPFGDEYFDS